MRPHYQRMLDDLLTRTEQQAHAGARIVVWSEVAAFVLLYATVFHGPNFARFAAPYFAAQTALVAGLIALSIEGIEFFTMLFFILTIHAGLVFPERGAAMWIALFFGISSLGHVAR